MLCPVTLQAATTWTTAGADTKGKFLRRMRSEELVTWEPGSWSQICRMVDLDRQPVNLVDGSEGVNDIVVSAKVMGVY